MYFYFGLCLAMELLRVYIFLALKTPKKLVWKSDTTCQIAIRQDFDLTVV